MSAENMENDHDYLASRSVPNEQQNSQDYEFSSAVRSRRRILTLNTQRLAAGASNSDHDYLYAPATRSSQSTGNNNVSGGLSGTMAADYDIFQQEDDNINDIDEVVDEAPQIQLDAASTGTVATHSRSVTPTISTGNESDTSTSLASVSSDASAASHSTISSEMSVSSHSTNTSHSSASSGSTVNVPIARPPTQSDDNPSTSRGRRERTASQQHYQPVVTEIITLSPDSPPKKRNRLSLEASDKSTTPKVNTKALENNDEDEDDGLTCPICLDSWEMSGDHRLVSLKCGHLFGEACIRRWLKENARMSGQKACPQCKTKAEVRDIRYLYAKRLRAIDRSEEHRMREELCIERSKCKNLELDLATMKMNYAQVIEKIKLLESDNEALRRMMHNPGAGQGARAFDLNTGSNSQIKYKLFMEKNIELSRESGCRVMKYADHHSMLIVSQRSSQGLFPGYGLRFVDTSTFKPTNFLHTSIKIVRDLSLSEDQQLLAVASMEQRVKLFDLRSLQVVTQFKPSEKPIWSCAIARRESEHYLHLGSQHGSTYVYDIRYPETFLDEHVTEADYSPVIHVAAVPESEQFPGGAFIVCKLTSLWLYEYQAGGGVQGTRLAVEGRLISMSYVTHNQSLLVQTRSCPRFPGARFILGKLDRIEGIPVFNIKVTFCANTNSPVMVRSTQIDMDSNSLVAAYVQDCKKLSIYDANSEKCIQSMSVLEVIYDTCPIYLKNLTYVAALSETKCRLYKVNTT